MMPMHEPTDQQPPSDAAEAPAEPENAETPEAPPPEGVSFAPAVAQEVRIGGRQGVRVTQSGPMTVRRAGAGTPDDLPPPAESAES